MARTVLVSHSSNYPKYLSHSHCRMTLLLYRTPCPCARWWNAGVLFVVCQLVTKLVRGERESFYTLSCADCSSREHECLAHRGIISLRLLFTYDRSVEPDLKDKYIQNLPLDSYHMRFRAEVPLWVDRVRLRVYAWHWKRYCNEMKMPLQS